MSSESARHMELLRYVVSTRYTKGPMSRHVRSAARPVDMVNYAKVDMPHLHCHDADYPHEIVAIQPLGWEY